MAQTSVSIQGTVVNAVTREPLASVNVEVLHTVLGSTTDSDGRFTIRGLSPGAYVLRISHMGYRTQIVTSVQVKTGGAAEVRVALEPAPLMFNPIVVTAEKREQNLQDSPNSISVLSSAEIESRNSLRLDEALETVPGVYFMKEDINIRGSTGYRANSANRVLVMVDGIPVMTSDIGGISWDVLPILDIDRIEVVKGAGSALWGSYALGGVVNIITKTPKPDGTFQFRFTGGIYDDPSEAVWIWAPDRTLNYNRVDLAYSKLFGNVGMRLSFSRHKSTGDRLDGDFEKLNISGKFNVRFADTSELLLYFSWLRDHSGYFVEWRSPFVADSSDASPSQLFHPLLPDVEGNLLRLNWLNAYLKYKRPLSVKSYLQFRVSLLNSMLGDQFRVSGDYFPANGLGSEVQLTWTPQPDHFVTAGAEFKLNLVKGVFFGGEHKEYLIAPYVQDEWRLLPKLTLTMGARFDRYQILDGPVEFQVSPRFGLNYKAPYGVILRASAGRGFRSPTVAERTVHFDTGNFLIKANPDIKAERSWSYEIGVRKPVAHTSFVDVSIFENDYRNFIEARPDLAQSDSLIVVGFRNLTKARIRGLEFGAGSRWWQGRLGLDGSFTYLDTRDFETGRPLSYRPRWIAQVGPSLSLGPVEIRADYRFASRVLRVEIYTQDQRVAQHELNVRFLYHFHHLTFVAGSNNVLNYNYTQVERNLGEIRNFFVSLQGRL